LGAWQRAIRCPLPKRRPLEAEVLRPLLLHPCDAARYRQGVSPVTTYAEEPKPSSYLDPRIRRDGPCGINFQPGQRTGIGEMLEADIEICMRQHEWLTRYVGSRTIETLERRQATSTVYAWHAERFAQIRRNQLRPIETECGLDPTDFPNTQSSFA